MSIQQVYTYNDGITSESPATVGGTGVGLSEPQKSEVEYLTKEVVERAKTEIDKKILEMKKRFEKKVIDAEKKFDNKISESEDKSKKEQLQILAIFTVVFAFITGSLQIIKSDQIDIFDRGWLMLMFGTVLMIFLFLINNLFIKEKIEKSNFKYLLLSIFIILSITLFFNFYLNKSIIEILNIIS